MSDNEALRMFGSKSNVEDERVILKWILKTRAIGPWIGFSWLKIATNWRALVNIVP
jgi:hypothetical protein